MSKYDNQCTVVNTVPIPPSVTHYLQPPDSTDTENEVITKTALPTFGGITSNLQYAWISNGPRFQVVELQTGTRVASWLFGGVLRDKRTRVTCVTELKDDAGNTPIFIIGLQCDLTGGMICIFDIIGSRVLRAIHIDDKVSTICVITPGCGNDEIGHLPGMLRIMDGVLAVGTAGGETYLVDICRDIWKDEEGPPNDELNVCRLLVRSTDNLNASQLSNFKNLAERKGEHFAIHLNGSTRPIFTLWTPEGDPALQLPRESVNVTALLFVPKLVSFFVGYNFGTWQLYNLLTMELEYTSAVYEEIVPISHFAYQEPSDDPRAFCYIWVVYSKDARAEHPSDPLAAMYALSFETKENIEDFGILYQKFTSCSLRFQMDLLPLSDLPDRRGGHCIGLHSYVGAPAVSGSDGSDLRLAMCMIVWSSWPVDADQPEVIMAIIDLDQWYKEQMPATLRESGNDSYMMKLNLSTLLKMNDDEPILDVHVDVSSLSPFTAAHRLEEHYYPSALAFEFTCVQNSNLTTVKNSGLQRHLLLTIEENGVDGFLQPNELAEQCIEAGLQPISADVTPRSKPTAHDQLLSIALEHNLIGLLTACARQWATGIYASMGCTLGMFVEWAAQRTEILQQKANELCVSLFDFSDVTLDCNARRVLDQCAKQLHHLASIFKFISKTCSQHLNTEGITEINEHLRALQMTSNHLEVLQWLLNVGLLPEAPSTSFHDPTEATAQIRAPYPAETLTRYYSDRRAELNAMCGVPEKEVRKRPCELLYIDNLIKHECGGSRLQREWQKGGDSGNNTGLYPPRSLQALLRTYLLDGVELHHKHTVLVYVFLDLAMTLDQNRYSSIITHLIKFPAVFRLTPSHIKITQAFWQLDHGDYATGIEQLLDPLVGGGSSDDLRPWQHKTILRVLLAHQQHKFASLYLQVRHPPLTDVNDICDALNMLIANNMLHAAFQFQRRHRTIHNSKIILTNFFASCMKFNLITSALKLSLTPEEENTLLETLNTNNFVGNNLQLMFYLQRSRGFEAAQMMKQRKSSTKIAQQGLIGQQTIELPQILLSTYMNAMPKITTTLFEQCQSYNNKEKATWVEVERPTPMSINVKNGSHDIKYKSNIISESVAKVCEIWANTTVVKDIIREPQDIDSTPFLCTPKKLMPLKHLATPIIFPKITYQSLTKLGPYDINSRKRTNYDTPEEETGAPVKRLKYENGEAVPTKYTAPEKLLMTPVVKRSSSSYPNYDLKTSSENISYEIHTYKPHSILKSSRRISTASATSEQLKRGETVTPELGECDKSTSDMDLDLECMPLANNSISSNFNSTIRGSLLGATPRKMLVRSARPNVHFQDGPSEQAAVSTQFQLSTEHKEKLMLDLSTSNSSVQVSEKTTQEESSSPLQEDAFYSPNTSVSEDLDKNESHFSPVKQTPTIVVESPPPSRFSPRQCVRNKYAAPTSSASPQNEREAAAIARKLITNSPYRSVRGRKSLQRTVLENTLVKNIAPSLKPAISSPKPSSQARAANPSSPKKASPYQLRSSTPISEDCSRQEESFNENVTYCSSPVQLPSVLNYDSRVSESVIERLQSDNRKLDGSIIELESTNVKEKFSSTSQSLTVESSISSERVLSYGSTVDESCFRKYFQESRTHTTQSATRDLNEENNAVQQDTLSWKTHLPKEDDKRNMSKTLNPLNESSVISERLFTDGSTVDESLIRKFLHDAQAVESSSNSVLEHDNADNSKSLHFPEVVRSDSIDSLEYMEIAIQAPTVQTSEIKPSGSDITNAGAEIGQAEIHEDAIVEHSEIVPTNDRKIKYDQESVKGENPEDNDPDDDSADDRLEIDEVSQPSSSSSYRVVDERPASNNQGEGDAVVSISSLSTEASNNQVVNSAADEAMSEGQDDMSNDRGDMSENPNSEPSNISGDDHSRDIELDADNQAVNSEGDEDTSEDQGNMSEGQGDMSEDQGNISEDQGNMSEGQESEPSNTSEDDQDGVIVLDDNSASASNYSYEQNQLEEGELPNEGEEDGNSESDGDAHIVEEYIEQANSDVDDVDEVMVSASESEQEENSSDSESDSVQDSDSEEEEGVADGDVVEISSDDNSSRGSVSGIEQLNGGHPVKKNKDEFMGSPKAIVEEEDALETIVAAEGDVVAYTDVDAKKDSFYGDCPMEMESDIVKDTARNLNDNIAVLSDEVETNANIDENSDYIESAFPYEKGIYETLETDKNMEGEKVPDVTSHEDGDRNITVDVAASIQLQAEFADSSLISADRTLVGVESTILLTDDESDMSMQISSPVQEKNNKVQTKMKPTQEEPIICLETNSDKEVNISSESPCITKSVKTIDDDVKIVEKNDQTKSSPNQALEETPLNEEAIAVVESQVPKPREKDIPRNGETIVNTPTTGTQLRPVRRSSRNKSSDTLPDKLVEISVPNTRARRASSLSHISLNTTSTDASTSLVKVPPRRRSTQSKLTISLDEDSELVVNQDKAEPANTKRVGRKSVLPKITELVAENVASSSEGLNDSVFEHGGETSTSVKGATTKAKQRKKSVGEPDTKQPPDNALEQYSTSRRLTRRQQSLMSKSIAEVTGLYGQSEMVLCESSSDDERENHGSDSEPIDRIVLMDKGDFEGVPDPDERKILEYSPTSSIKTTSSVVSEGRFSRVKTRSQTSEGDGDSIPRTPPRAVKGQHSLSGSNSPNINKSTLTPNSKSVATPTRRSSRRLSNSSIQKTPDSDDVSEVSSITSSVSRKSASALVAQRLLEGAAGVEVRRSSRKSLLSPKSSNPDPQLKTTGLASRRTLMPSIEEETAGASKRNTAEDGPSPAKRGRSRKSSASSAAIRFLSPLPTEEIEQACRRKTQSKRASSIDLTVTAPSRRTTFKVNRKRPSSSSEK